MSISIIENDREAYIKFSDVITPEDISNYRILEIYEGNKPVTVMMDSVIWSNANCESLVGIVLLSENYDNVKIKGLKEEYKNAIDKFLKI